MDKRMEHKAVFMGPGRVEAAPGLEVGRRYDAEAVAAVWRRHNELELAEELAQERARRQKFLERVGPAKAAELERTAMDVRRKLATQREQERQRAAHEQRLTQIRRRIAEDQADERTIARLKAGGVPESDRRIQILRLGIVARKYEGEVKR